VAKPSLEDMKTMYANSLLLIKNTPVYVDTIYSANKVGGLNINTQRKEIYELKDHTDLKAPGRCLGFVNVDGHATFLYRTPVRKYKVGLDRGNAQFTFPEGFKIALRDPIYHLQAPEIADTIKGRYPSIADAWERVKGKAEKVVAFDRQFAIDYRGVVFFKTLAVGKAAKAKTVYDIQFDKGNEYLILLLDNNHEKTVRAA